MNTIKDTHLANSPEGNVSLMTTPSSISKDPDHLVHRVKTPMRKDELEKIAKELKMKLSKASVTAKQLLTSSSSTNLRNLGTESPQSLTSLPRSSPLKNYYMWKRQIASGNPGNLTLLPSLYSPDRKLPTLTKPSVFLSSSPLKNITDIPMHSSNTSRKNSLDTEAMSDLNDSPIKRRRAESGAAIKPSEPHLVLHELSKPLTPHKPEALHPSPVLTSDAYNDRHPPSLKPLAPSNSTRKISEKNLLKTPTQPSRGSMVNDNEGADLLMYLATSPSPVKPLVNGSKPPTLDSGVQVKQTNGPFIVPQPPRTPKRNFVSLAKTPQNRLTPGLNGSLMVPGSALPSAGLALTPAGFNMNDYVNFFTPSPGAAAHGHANLTMERTLLKTPDFNAHLQSSSKTTVDGKMINFDKAELFNSEPAKD